MAASFYSRAKDTPLKPLNALSIDCPPSSSNAKRVNASELSSAYAGLTQTYADLRPSIFQRDPKHLQTHKPYADPYAELTRTYARRLVNARCGGIERRRGGIQLTQSLRGAYADLRLSLFQRRCVIKQQDGVIKHNLPTSGRSGDTNQT